MKKIEIVILISIILLCTGCDITYNLTIKSKNSIKEVITAMLPGNYTEESNKYMMYQYKKLYGNVYDIKSEIKQDNYYLYFNRSLNTLNNNEIKNYFNLTYNENNDSVEIVAIPNDELKILLTPIDVLEPEIEKLTINIKIIPKVMEHNAKSIKDNIYTWEYNSENLAESIKFTFENKIKTAPSKKNLKINPIFIIIGGLTIIGGIILLLIKVVIANKNNNKL